MFEKPALKAHVRADVAAPDLVVVRSEDGRLVLEGRLLPLLLPRIDGSRSPSEIARSLAGQLTIVDVEFGLSLLHDEGLLREGAGRAPIATAAFRDTLGHPSGHSDRRLAAASVEVLALGGLDVEPLVDALDGQDVRVAERGDLLVVLTDDYLDPRLAEIDRVAERPWLLAKPVGAVVWIGPIFRSGETPCWRCLARRLTENQPDRVPVAGPQGDPAARAATAVPAPSTPVTRALAAQAIAVQVWRWVGAGRYPDLEGQLLSLDVRTLASHGHRVVRQPCCAGCGRSGRGSAPAPLCLRAVSRHSVVDGGHRAVSAEATYRRLAHHVSPVTGVVGWVRDHGDTAGTVQVYVADHVFRSRDPAEALRTGQRRRSAGKGASAAQARASALCEALERYSGVFHDGVYRRSARFTELDQAVHPDDLQGFSADQFENRSRWNAASEPRSWVPMVFDEDRPVDWSPAWSLTEDRFKHVPTAWGYYHAPLPEDHRFCRGESNGCAAGSCLEEAILQGFFELVERDAVGLWWHNQVRRPAVDVASFEQPEIDALAKTVRALGRSLHVLDLSTDFAAPASGGAPGIVTFAALSWSAVDRDQPLFGFGAHFDAGIALSRALTEMCQFLPGLVSGRARRILSEPLVDDMFLEPSGVRHAHDFAIGEVGDLRDEVAWCVELARQRGLETLVLDQTRPDIDLSVVKVIVPGLRHFWPRYGPGRLYDVPVALGWLAAPRRECLLNPSHLLI